MKWVGEKPLTVGIAVQLPKLSNDDPIVESKTFCVTVALDKMITPVFQGTIA